MLSFGILIFPGFSLFSVFALMAVILIVRPWGLFGRPITMTRRRSAFSRRVPWTLIVFLIALRTVPWLGYALRHVPRRTRS